MTEPVNLTNLREMIGGDPDVEQELFAVFLSSSDDCLEKLKKNTSEETDEAWRAQAHAWKGMCLNLGADPLSKLCAEAQLHDNIGEIGKTELIAKLEKEYNDVKIYLNTPT